jgi:hypothetical protein
MIIELIREVFIGGVAHPGYVIHILRDIDPGVLNPEPAPPTQGVADAVKKMMSWLRWIAFAGIVGAAISGLAMMAFGRAGGNLELSKNGQRSIGVAIVCAVLFTALYQIITKLA